MVSRMATSYEPQVTQVNEELIPKTSLDLTLTHVFVMKIPNLKRCVFILKLNPLELGIIAYLQTFAPW
jgi:hypothetical protein